LLALAVGAAIGGAARVVAPRHVPRRAHVAIILAAVGAALGTLGYAISRWNWDALAHLSPGTAIASAAGAIAVLLAFDVLPRVAPAMPAALPGRDDQVER
jgi:uncharacterized membrane protein YeaQ/YmgE (transglycosylase-associated protein family)